MTGSTQFEFFSNWITLLEVTGHIIVFIDLRNGLQSLCARLQVEMPTTASL